MTDSTAWSATLGLARTYCSRLVNAWRLRDLPDHSRRVERSRRLLRKLRSSDLRDEPGRCFAYLRKVDPLVFEELVLTAMETAGWMVLRSRRYSGDGGVDGHCFVPGYGLRPWAVQVKRYARHVDARDVGALGSVVHTQGLAGGLFIHCGRTGAMSWEFSSAASLRIVSGQQLLDLLLLGILPRIRARSDAVSGQGGQPAYERPYRAAGRN